VDDLTVTCRLTACIPGSAPGPTLGIEYGKPLPFTFFIDTHTHTHTGPIALPGPLKWSVMIITHYSYYWRIIPGYRKKHFCACVHALA